MGLSMVFPFGFSKVGCVNPKSCHLGNGVLTPAGSFGESPSRSSGDLQRQCGELRGELVQAQAET